MRGHFWGSVSCPRTLRLADGEDWNQTADLLVGERPFYPSATAKILLTLSHVPTMHTAIFEMSWGHKFKQCLTTTPGGSVYVTYRLGFPEHHQWTDICTQNWDCYEMWWLVEIPRGWTPLIWTLYKPNSYSTLAYFTCLVPTSFGFQEKWNPLCVFALIYFILGV